MAVQEEPALADRVYSLLGDLGATDTSSVGPETDLRSIGFDSLACAEFSAVVVASPRPVRMMAKRELFEKPWLARFFHELGGFSVDRDAFDLRAVEIALEVIRRGEVLGMYPEGTRTPGTLLPFLPGAAWIAL